MVAVGGFLFLIACVFGGFAITGGSIGAVLGVMPFELITIGGAAIGAFAISNKLSAMSEVGRCLGKVFKGAAHTKADYVDLLCTLFALIRLATTKGAQGVEPHIERPESSAIFGAFPRVTRHRHAVGLICDYMRMVGMNADDPNQLEDVMARELRKDLQERLHPAHALQVTADSLPALGIVAAVLGVIKTMSHIDQPPAVLGEMIGSALVGTFLGVLLAYGLVGPVAYRIRDIVEEEGQFAEIIRAVLVAFLHGNAPQVCVETGRKMVPGSHMPSFQEVEEAIGRAPGG